MAEYSPGPRPRLALLALGGVSLLSGLNAALLLVGVWAPVDAAHLPGLWACTAMGSRGLTLAVLCAELLAARLQGEPLPLDPRLARALGSERL